MPDSQTREEVDAKIAASEARGETKIARIEGKLDLLIDKVGSLKEDGRATRANIWVVGMGIAVLIVGVVAVFPAFFDIGSHIKEMVDQAVAALKHS